MRKKQILCMLMGVLISMNSYAQVNLIPFPQKVIYGNSNFTIDENTKIVASSLDSFYVNQLLTSVKQELGVTLNWVKKARSKQIEFIKVPTPDKYKAILKSNSLDSDFNIGTEGYVINITPQTIQIISQSDAGVFYGIQTLKQLLIANRVGNNIPCMVIYDYPDMPVRAWQDDISRGPIPTMGMLKLQIEKMASYKLNYFSLYIEHVFKLDKHPGIAPKDGISKAEIEELSAFAEKYHVNLVGSYQSFGHMEKTLAHPNYQHLAETDHIISPALDESYEFLSDVYQEIVPTFSGDYFNINCDETFGLGEGKSKSMVDRLGIDGVYLFHINKLNTILKQYDKKVLMWGDIITDYPLIINQLPKDITVIAWGYHAADNFESTIMPFYKSGANFWVAPGVNCWSNIFPNFKETQVNIYNLIRDGHKYKATGVFNTTWDDDGLNFFHNNWHGLIWGAENSWNTPDYKSSIEESNNARKIRYNAFNQAFDAIFYGLESDSIIADIIAFSNLHQSGVRDVLKNSRFFEPIFPIHLEYVKKGKKQDNLQLLLQLDEINNRIESVIPKIKQNRITIDYLKFAIRQVQFTLHKNIFRINLSHFMKNEEEVTTSEIKKGI
ncbi:MAG: beta-N-acetylhexosaminidase, partial [Salinivirgaceae bacterium]|nr:beta-N-acetylhexosaminidase [Salinivirgaceae bacterium]